MDYEALTPEYRRDQIARLVKAIRRLGELETSPGLVVPDTDDLVIGAGRRLNAAVMFLDISGFSSWPAEWPHEQAVVLARLNLFFSEMVKIAEDYGGFVEKNTGDGLMAYFEDLGGQESAEGSKRAVACALTMFDTNRSLLSAILASARIPPIRFRIAIDYGPVTIGRLGAARRFNSVVAIGTTANIASKMLSFAQADEILVGQSVQQRLPLDWQLLWTQVIDAPTGWLYRISGLQYPFYRYTGRWIAPVVQP